MSDIEQHAQKIQRAFKRSREQYNERYVSRDGKNIRVMEYDGGDHHSPVVFLHGWGGDLHVWFPVIDMLREQEISHVLVDLPGFGESSDPENGAGVEEYSESVAHLLEGLDMQKVMLVGHSFGGQVASQFAATHPDVVEKLVLVDAACIRRRSKRLREMFASAVKPIFSLPVLRRFSDKIIAWVVGDDFDTNPALYETMKKVVNQDLRDVLPDITAPTLIIWGEDDVITPLDQGYTIQENIPNSLLTVLPDAGHYSLLDKTEEFSDSLISFITS